MDVNRHNQAVTDDRIRKVWASPDHKGEYSKCSWCGEQVWQYPRPQYWLQYPMPEIFCIDDNIVCSEKCVEDYLIEHPVKAGQQLKMF